MSSNNIVRDCRTLIQNKLLEVVPTKWLPQLGFGLEAFALRPFQSAGSNARAVIANPHTADSKVYRLLRNEKLASYLGTVFDQLDLVRADSYVNVDHSDFDGLTALVGAIQTRNGRAVPCMVETTYALHIPAAGSALSAPRWEALRTDMQFAREQQSFTGHTIDALQTLADRLGFWPRLVFDRGFGNGSIVEHLCAEGATFYIRLKAGNYVECDGQTTRIAMLKDADTTVRLFGLPLRIVRSDQDGTNDEPWYILTNDMATSRDEIIQIYYYRFEIEESFKDTKHLFELYQLRFNRPTSLKVVLWLVFLGIAVLYVVTRSGMQTASRSACNSKKLVSWVRLAYEQFERELTRLRNMTGLTSCPRGQV
jgi:hypothetical protein